MKSGSSLLFKMYSFVQFLNLLFSCYIILWDQKASNQYFVFFCAKRQVVLSCSHSFYLLMLLPPPPPPRAPVKMTSSFPPDWLLLLSYLPLPLLSSWPSIPIHVRLLIHSAVEIHVFCGASPDHCIWKYLFLSLSFYCSVSQDPVRKTIHSIYFARENLIKNLFKQV